MKFMLLPKKLGLALLLLVTSLTLAQAQYCLPNFGAGCAFDDNINSFTLGGAGTTSIFDTGTHCSSGAYRNMSGSMSVTLAQGGNYNAFINTDYFDEFTEVYIDFNDDGTFSSSESVGGASWIDTAGVTFTIRISPNADTGAHRMRVILTYDYSYPGIDPCPDSNAGYIYGEVHDYTANIILGSGGACDAPVNIVVSGITDTSSVFSWDAVPGAIGYEYVVDTTGTLPTGSGTPVSGNFAVPATLRANTRYYFHVRSKCGPVTFSSWVTQSFFTNASGTDWVYVRPDNTGLGGDYNATVTGDHFGNIWMGGYMPKIEQGSVVRLNGQGVFTNWGTYEGLLPDGQVQSIAFDYNDQLWVGTTKSISRFNGTSWISYDRSNSPLHHDGVSSLAVDKKNDIWAVTFRYNTGTGSDLAHFNGTSWVLHTAGQPTPDLYYMDLDSAGNKWIGSPIGLLKYDGSAWTQYTDTNSGLSGSYAFDVHVDSLNRIWCTSGGDINIFDGSSWTTLNTWPDSNFRADYFYTRGNKLIVADYNSWDILIQNGTGWLTHKAPGWISDVYIDTFGHYWVAGQGFVSSFDGTAWKDYTRYNSGLTEYFNNDVFVDSKNRKWFSNGNGGIQVFDCPKWEVYGPLNGGMFPSPQKMTTIGTCVTEDSRGDIWMTYDGTYGYAVQIPGGNYSNYSAWKYWNDTTVGVPGFQGIQEVVASTDGKVFMLTFWGEIFMFDHATNAWTSFAYGRGLNVNPRTIAAGLNGKVYALGYAAMDEFSNGTWTNFDFAAHGLPITYINDMAFDSSRNMWLATSEGVWKYDSTATAWRNWNDTNSNVAADFVTSIEINKKTGEVYVGAYNFNTWPYYGGMSVMKDSTWISYLQGSSSLPHKQVEDLALDTLGNIWMIPQSEGIAVFRQGGVRGLGCIDRTLQMRMIQNPTSVPQTRIGQAEFAVYPNPVSGAGTLSFTMPGQGQVRVGLYDLQGRFIRELFNGNMPMGSHKVSWNSNGLSAGIYMVRFTTGTSAAQQKIVVQ